MSQGPKEGWTPPAPFFHHERAGAEDIDALGHVNNAVYFRWFTNAAWAHSTALGLSEADCAALDRAMVIQRSEVVYLRAVREGEAVTAATWILSSDERLRCARGFELRAADGRVAARATMAFVCVRITTGAPTRMPAAFQEAYRPLEVVAAALAQTPWRLDDA